MIRKTVLNDDLPRLGFGAMRLPTLADGSVAEDLTQRMVDYAMAHGVNYFDTAVPYHSGTSEIVMGKALARYPRESFFLADKMPGYDVTCYADCQKYFDEWKLSKDTEIFLSAQGGFLCRKLSFLSGFQVLHHRSWYRFFW